jgi:nucleotide-binding universal stress UspA family protein
MTIKTIAVSLNDVDNLDHLLPTAVAMAVAHDAHLSGVYVIPSVEVYAAYSGMAMAEVVDTQRKRYLEMSDGVRGKFARALDANGLQGEFHQLDAISVTIAREFCEAARVADVAVIAQVDSENHGGVEGEFAGTVAMDLGRPVVIVPRGRSFDPVGSKVVIGWNGTREAARACFDALPMLQAGADITLVWVDPQKNAREAGNVPGTEMASALARHGFKVTAEPMPTANGDAGEALLTKANDIGADLLVMGAYGHSRLRQFVFGGASETVLSGAPLPVLMSH